MKMTAEDVCFVIAINEDRIVSLEGLRSPLSLCRQLEESPLKKESTVNKRPRKPWNAQLYVTEKGHCGVVTLYLRS